MHVEILQENLQKTLQSVLRFVPSRTSLPILSNIYIETAETGLLIYSSNTEQSIKIQVPSKVIEPGKVAIPAKIFGELIQNLPPGKLTLLSQGYVLKIERPEYSAEINGVNPAEYPISPTLTGSDQLSLSAQLLTTVSQLVSFVVAVDDSRPVLTGLLIELTPNAVTFVATDGFRLSRLTEKKIATSFSETKQLLIPLKVIHELDRLIKDDHIDELTLSFSEDAQSVILELPHLTLISRLIDGTYPPYQKIIPENFQTQLSVDRQLLLDSIKVASLFARQNGQIITWKMTQNELLIESQSTQVGKQQSRIPIHQITPERTLTLGFNSKFIQDILNHLSDSEVIISLNGELQAVQFTSKTANFLHIIMPIKI